SLFEVNEEGAAMFLAWEAERMLREYHDGPRMASMRAFFTYVELGIISTARKHQAVLDTLMRRASWKRREGLAGEVDVQELLGRTLSDAQRGEFVAQPMDEAGPPRPLSLRERLCEPVFL